MYLFLFFLFLVIPAVLGVAEILHYLKLTMLSYREDGHKLSCIILDDENAVIQLKAFCEESNWNGIKSGKECFAIYKNLSENIFNECKTIANKNDIEFLSLEEFYNEIKDF